MLARSTQLLLLPSVPSDLDEEACLAAWKPTLTQALINASKTPHTDLDIAALFSKNLQPQGTRGQAFNFYQTLLAAIYRMCCHICSAQGIDPVKEGYVDFRVLLITDDEEPDLSLSTQLSQGPIFSFQRLASSDRQWQVVQCAEGKAGDDLLNSFVNIRRSSAASPRARAFVTVRVPGGTTMIKQSEQLPSREGKSQPKPHTTVAVGGTFDNLHEGHKLLLSATALVLDPCKGLEPPSRRLIVGVTGDQLLTNKKYPEMLESWDQRQLASFCFLRDIVSLYGHDAVVESTEKRNEPGPNGKAVIYNLKGALTIECVEIQDPFGPTITDESVSALIISAETRSGGQAVNDRRKEKGWPPLEVFEVDVLGPEGASDLQDKMSSTERRRRRLEASSNL